MELKFRVLLMNSEKHNQSKLISEKKWIYLLLIYPNDEQKSAGESPLLNKTYEELFYVEDSEDEFDDIDLEIEE